MYKQYLRRTSRKAQWARRLALFSLVLLLTSALGHRYRLVETIPFFWLLAIVLILATLALALAYGGYLDLVERDYKAGRASSVALLVSLLVLAPFAWWGYQFWRYPQLAEISTDLEDPPPFGALAGAQAGNEAERVAAARLQIEHYPDVSGRRYDVPLAAVLIALDELVQERGWWFLPDASPGTTGRTVAFEIEAPTALLRLPTDAAIRLIEEEVTVKVDMRMRTRHVGHDLGANAPRIATFMADLDARVAAIMREPEIVSDEQEGSID